MFERLRVQPERLRLALCVARRADRSRRRRARRPRTCEPVRAQCAFTHVQLLVLALALAPGTEHGRERRALSAIHLQRPHRRRLLSRRSRLDVGIGRLRLLGLERGAVADELLLVDVGIDADRSSFALCRRHLLRPLLSSPAPPSPRLRWNFSGGGVSGCNGCLDLCIGLVDTASARPLHRLEG